MFYPGASSGDSSGGSGVREKPLVQIAALRHPRILVRSCRLALAPEPHTAGAGVQLIVEHLARVVSECALAPR